MMKQKLQDTLQKHQEVSASFLDFFKALEQAAEKIDTPYKKEYEQQVKDCKNNIFYALGRIDDTLPELDIIISAIENKQEKGKD